jgi:transcriptional regulator, LysR family
MLDGMSVDQLRTFIAAVDEGSFSAAGRRLRRAQSVVSATLANLEAQVGFPLFDRTGRYPTLTEAGVAMLEAARLATAGMDAFKAKARTLAEGLEPELAVSVDVMFPVAQLTAAVQAFQQAFPDTPLRLYVEALGAVFQPLLDGHCRVAITGSLPHLRRDASQNPSQRAAVAVVSPEHPLANASGPILRSLLQEHVQLVLTDRSSLTVGRSFGVMSSKTWHLADMGAKHAFLRAGLGWGYMPLPMVEEDLAAGKLVTLNVPMQPDVGPGFSMQAVHLEEHPPGPAGRWFVNRLKMQAGMPLNERSGSGK